jgi:hypothetical protein
MPRKAHLNVPGAVYHVMGRCLDHVTLFADDADREQFLSLRLWFLPTISELGGQRLRHFLEVEKKSSKSILLLFSKMATVPIAPYCSIA